MVDDLEALKRLLEDKIALSRVAFEGSDKPKFVCLGFSDAQDVLAALERGAQLEALARKLVQRGPQSAVWPEFYDLVTERPDAWKQATGRAPSPDEEGSDG